MRVSPSEIRSLIISSPYQLAFFRPGIKPSFAILRRQTRQGAGRSGQGHEGAPGRQRPA